MQIIREITNQSSLPEIAIDVILKPIPEDLLLMKRLSPLSKNHKILIILFVSLIPFLFTCEKLPFLRDHLSGPFRYKFVPKAKNISPNSYFFDLDRDGQEEYIEMDNKFYEKAGRSYIKIHDNRFGLRSQLNVNGILQSPHRFDWNSDGILDIALFYSRNDSLFIKIADENGLSLVDETYLISGKSVWNEHGTHRWHGSINDLHWDDLDSDGKSELILFFSEGHPLKPRGVYIYDGITFQPIWHYETGPPPKNRSFIFDYNNDGYKDILFSTSAPCNGNIANGMSDDESYFIQIDYKSRQVFKQKYGSQYSSVRIFKSDFDGDNSEDILLFFWQDNEKKSAYRLEFWNPVKKEMSPSRKFLYELQAISTVRVGRTSGKGILLTDKQGNLFLLDHNLNDIRSMKFGKPILNISTCEDIDNDGFEEIFIGTEAGNYMLDNKLRPKAVIPITMQSLNFDQIQIFHKKGEKPLIAFYTESAGVLASLEKSDDYLIAYYGPSVLLFFGIILVLGIALSLIRDHKEKQNLKAIVEKTIAVNENPAFLIESGNRIIFANAGARETLNINEKDLPIKITSIENPKSALIEQLQELQKCDPIRQEKSLNIKTLNRANYQFIAEPILESKNKSPFWLVILNDTKVQAELDQARTWSAMAQRIAHDIKNPLTSILLTLQRLQMEYRDKDVENSAQYDHYTDRIQERIETLRRMSRDFMKFINLEKMNKQPADVNKLIRRLFEDSVIVLPKDIHLVQKLSRDIPTTHLDQEQIQTVIENLVSNSINAMPEGGTLTLATSLASNLHLNKAANKSGNYIILEVMDTGTGIPSSLQKNLFQPYTTNTYLGTGLGLTIVKKIIEDHAGYIEINTEENVGTSFFLYLPVA